MRAAHVTHDDSLDQSIQSKDDLLHVFHSAVKPREKWRVGAEMEKFGVDAKSGAPIHYEGPRGVVAILNELAARHGWTPESEIAGGPVLALVRGSASITLEPGGQLELSGAPAETVHEICAEFRAHMAELAAITKELDLRWLGIGFHPFAKREDLTFVPKQRYPIMRDYLPTRGAHALDMMLRTATVQANYDYSSEADAITKMRVGLRLAPLTTALFANSPWKEGARHGGLSYRGRVWLDVDPDRSGLVPSLWAKDASFDTYVDWALDVPMFMFKREGRKVANTGQTFRSFWKNGFQGYRAVQADWQMHLNTLFPEVRLKKTIEVRGADAQTQPFACALPALWTGIFYDERALAQVDALTADFTVDEVSALREEAWKVGVRATFRGKPLFELGSRIIAIAEGGLERRGYKTPGGKDERVHLARLKELVQKGLGPADALLDGLGGDSPAQIMERAELVAKA
jgi:glutamate--cysteine ligase